MEPKPRVLLWRTARSLSTAFERSIRTLENGKVFHSPYVDAYFYGAERCAAGSSYISADAPIKPNSTYKEITEEISSGHEEYAFVFANILVDFIVGKFEEILLNDGMRNFKHSFLIRHPKKMFSSWYRSLNPAGYTNLSTEQYRNMSDLYDFIVRELNTTPIVVDADDLLQNPAEMMRLYYEETNLPYNENMIRWEPGMVADWEKYSLVGGIRWHEAVIQSSGFIQKENEASKVRSDLYHGNNSVREATDESMPFYNALYERRLRLAVD